MKNKKFLACIAIIIIFSTLSITIVSLYIILNTPSNTSPDNIPPIVNITTPEQGLYINGNKLFNLNKIIAIGDIVIEAIVIDNVAVDHVDFYIDNKQTKVATDIQEPFNWIWDTPSFGKYTIRAVGIDTSYNIDEDMIEICKIF